MSQSGWQRKGAVSYFLGLIASKLVLWSLTQLWWIQHFDSFLRAMGLPVVGRRPALIVQTGGKYLVIESKGRTNGYDSATLQSALQAKGMDIRIGVPDYYV